MDRDIWTSKEVNLSFLLIFSCVVYARVSYVERNKLDMFRGDEFTYKGIYIWTTVVQWHIGRHWVLMKRSLISQTWVGARRIILLKKWPNILDKYCFFTNGQVIRFMKPYSSCKVVKTNVCSGSNSSNSWVKYLRQPRLLCVTTCYV